MSRIRNDKGPENAVYNLKDAASSVLRFAEMDRVTLTTKQREMLKEIAALDVGMVANKGRMSI